MTWAETRGRRSIQLLNSVTVGDAVRSAVADAAPELNKVPSRDRPGYRHRRNRHEGRRRRSRHRRAVVRSVSDRHAEAGDARGDGGGRPRTRRPTSSGRVPSASGFLPSSATASSDRRRTSTSRGSRSTPTRCSATATGLDVHMINDADAAGVAEVRFGAGRGRDGVVMMLTFGTGIGSGLFIDGMLVPNTELGHLELDGHDAESKAAASARDRHGWSWSEWAERVQRYLRARRAVVLARPLHRRRGSEQAVGQVAQAHLHRHRDRAGADGQQRRHRRRRAERPSSDQVVAHGETFG